MRRITNLVWVGALVLLCGVLIGISGSSNAAETASFLKKGDRWLLVGDSITNTDTYRQIMKRVLDHYHPDNGVTFVNVAMNGVTSDYQAKTKAEPTVVSIMLGMNNIIHMEWGGKADYRKIRESYRKGMAESVRKYKALGAEVILMTPTYSDERISSYFSPMNTRRALEELGEDVRAIAAAEGCHWLPIAEELEAYQDSLGPNEMFRPDGVHPYGWGQYQIARTFIDHLNFAGELTGSRKLTPTPQPVAISVATAAPFMNTPEEGIALSLTAQKPGTVNVRWSLAGEHGSETLTLSEKPLVWKIPASAQALNLPLGTRRQAVVDLASDGKSSLYVVDFAKTRVLKPVDGVVKGEISSPAESPAVAQQMTRFGIQTSGERPEGSKVCDWKITERDDELWLTGEVWDNDIQWKAGWPFARDGLHMLFDFRPKGRFAGLNPDRDAYMVFLNVRTEPEFALSPLAWLGPRLQYTLNTAGTKTETGFRWTLGLSGGITDYMRFDVRKLDYYGFSLIVADTDAKGTGLFSAMPAELDLTPEQAFNQLMIVDRKGVFPGTETTTVKSFGY